MSNPSHIPEREQPITTWAWTWGSDEARRPGLLLVERMLPAYRSLGNVAVLAAGLSALAAWLMRRHSIALYAGAFLTALAAPGTIEALGTPLGPGWGTLCFGLAFLFIAAVRSAQGGGIGWQALYGAILAVIAVSEIVQPDLAGIAWPLILVAIGILLLVRGRPA